MYFQCLPMFRKVFKINGKPLIIVAVRNRINSMKMQYLGQPIRNGNSGEDSSTDTPWNSNEEREQRSKTHLIVK